MELEEFEKSYYQILKYAEENNLKVPWKTYNRARSTLLRFNEPLTFEALKIRLDKYNQDLKEYDQRNNIYKLCAEYCIKIGLNNRWKNYRNLRTMARNKGYKNPTLEEFYKCLDELYEAQVLEERNENLWKQIKKYSEEKGYLPWIKMGGALKAVKQAGLPQDKFSSFKTLIDESYQRKIINDETSSVREIAKRN